MQRLLFFYSTLFIFIVIFFIASDSILASGFADGLNSTAQGIGYKTSEEDTSLVIASYAGLLIGSIITLIGVIFMVLIFSGAFNIITSGGNEESISKGKNKIKNGAIGILIVFCAYAITLFILGAATGSGMGINLFQIGL